MIAAGGQVQSVPAMLAATRRSTSLAGLGLMLFFRCAHENLSCIGERAIYPSRCYHSTAERNPRDAQNGRFGLNFRCAAVVN